METINLNLKKIAFFGLCLMLISLILAMTNKLYFNALFYNYFPLVPCAIGALMFSIAFFLKIRSDERSKRPNLSNIPQSEKNKLIKDFSEITSKHTLELFMMLGLETHIECMIVNDYNREEFVFSFKKVTPKVKDTISETCDNLIAKMQEDIDYLKSINEAKSTPDNEPAYYVWDGINTDMTPVESLDVAKRVILHDYTEGNDIHPDIDSIFVVKKVMSTCYSDELQKVYFKEHE